MTHFDEAIPAALRVIRERCPEFTQLHIVRDTSGSLTLVLPDEALADGQWGATAAELHSALGVYSAGERRVLLAESDLIDSAEVLHSQDKVSLELRVWLIDHVLTNQDWIRKPIRSIPRVPTAVAYSVKGGVGRSTALAVCAWSLARKNHQVLVVDFDLEAPGIGSILLDQLPDTGLIDWLIEDLNAQGTVELLERCVQQSPVAVSEAGSVRVLPAYGSASENFVAKLGRVFGPTIGDGDAIEGLAERIDRLLETIMRMSVPPDAVLIDCRAGMHDIGSAVVTRLGAEAFLFARDDVQDWWAYRQIFRHLRISPAVAGGMGNDSDLRWKLKMVAAQTSPSDDVRSKWVNSAYEAWREFYDDEASEIDPNFSPHVFDRSDTEAPHFPLFVNFELGVRGLSLCHEASRPDWAYVEGVFGDFTSGVESRLWPPAAPVSAEDN